MELQDYLERVKNKMGKKRKTLSLFLGVFGLTIGMSLILKWGITNIFLYNLLGMFFLISGCLCICVFLSEEYESSDGGTENEHK